MKKRLILILALGFVFFSTKYMFATPGGEDDPVITLSYIEQIFMPSITKQIEQASAPVFEVVDIAAGKSIVCEAGTEFVLRKGAASVIATQKGGIANVTLGVDLQNGADVPPNSLLIVPVSDGRGITALNDVILMIKGKYTISEGL